MQITFILPIKLDLVPIVYNMQNVIGSSFIPKNTFKFVICECSHYFQGLINDFKVMRESHYHQKHCSFIFEEWKKKPKAYETILGFLPTYSISITCAGYTENTNVDNISNQY